MGRKAALSVSVSDSVCCCAPSFSGHLFFGGGFTENTREYYIELLKKTAEKEGRLPKKSDFSQDEVNRIKGIFGPWPWALEAAGLKESKKDERQEKNRQKHQRSREKRKQFKESGEDKNGTD